MVIGQFCDSYPPTLDGVARVTYAYCDGLTKLGHEVYYVAPKNKHAEEYPEVNKILSPGLKLPTEQWYVGVPVGVKYRKSLNEIPFDIVHAQSPFVAGAEAARIAKKLGIPLIATFHSKYYDDFLQRTHSKKLSKLMLKIVVDFYRKCDAVWTVNEGTREVLRSYGFDGEIRIMENGTDIEQVDDNEIDKLRKRLAPNQNELMLLFVGRHNKQKNLKEVIEAAKILKDKGVDFRLVTAGEGPDFDKTVKLAKKLGLEKETVFLGQVNERKTLMALYKLSDLLVFPSLYDSAPMVLREAAAMGTAGLLVKGSCSAENLEDGVNALIAESAEPEAIAEKIMEHKARLGEIGACAKKVIPKPWREIMTEVVKEYAELIKAKTKGC
ncbi:glycosyltransferase [Candidatus Saccharibacteria bacterium]|nr:glycosyltransferase [Candidatus Saccharibacteria bacterium]